MPNTAPPPALTPTLAPVPRTRSAYHYWTPGKIRFADIDVVGHANNNAIGAWFETSRVELLRELGILQNTGAVNCALAKMTLEFPHELAMFDQFEIGDAIARIGNTSFTMQSALFVPRGDDVQCAATCEAVCVLIDAATHRPTPIPADVRAILEKYAIK